MGHSNIKETLDTYGHLFANDLQDAVGNINTLFVLEEQASTLKAV